MSFNNFPNTNWGNTSFEPEHRKLNVICSDGRSSEELLAEAAKTCTHMDFVDGKVEDWFDSRYWTLDKEKGKITSKKSNSITPYYVLTKLFSNTSVIKNYWETDCLNYILFCYLYLLYKCLSKEDINSIYKDGFTIALPLPGTKKGCNWVKSTYRFERGTKPIKSYSGLVTRYGYDLNYKIFYWVKGDSNISLDELRANTGLSNLKEDDFGDIYTDEDDLLKNISVGSRLTYTCIPAPINVDYKNENIIYLGNSKFSAVPYCTPENPSKSLKQIKKDYSENCRDNLMNYYLENPIVAGTPYINSKNKFRNREVLLSSYEILELKKS